MIISQIVFFIQTKHKLSTKCENKVFFVYHKRITLWGHYAEL